MCPPSKRKRKHNRKTPNAKDKLTWNTLTKPPAHRRTHLDLLLGRRVHGRGRGPALGEERAFRVPYGGCERVGRKGVCVEEVGEKPREEGRREGREECEEVH